MNICGSHFITVSPKDDYAQAIYVKGTGREFTNVKMFRN
jgi:hypothetical protein